MTARVPVDAGDRFAALTDFDHTLVITAGAGTGKTSLLTGRVLSALIGSEIPAAAIFVTTFTEKAAGEMTERVEESLLALASGEVDADSDAGRAREVLAGHFALSREAIESRASALLDSELPAIETFHAFCLRVLVEFARDADLPPELRIADELDIDELFESFWVGLIDAEFGTEHGQPRLMTLEDWDRIIRNPGLVAAKTALRDWCKKPLLDELPIDLRLEPLHARTAEIVAGFDALLPAHPQASAFDAKTRPAIEAARALAGLADGARASPSLLAECQVFANLDSLPGISRRTPEPARGELKRLQRGLQRALRAWALLPDEPSTAALETLCRAAGRQFARRKAGCAMLTFDDCLVRCYRLLKEKPQVRKRLQSRFEHILVDEFQDTDPLQYDILFYLAQASEPVAGEDPRGLALIPGRLCIVGDAKQSIYRFRGADMEAYDRARAQALADGGRELHLTLNFRSRAPLLEVVNACVGPLIVRDVGYQPDYEPLVAHRAGEEGLAGVLLHVAHEGSSRERREHEARALADMVKNRVASEAEGGAGRRCFRDFAFLFRAFTDAELYGRELRQAGVPVLIEGGKRFYERYEVERLLALLSVVLRPHDEAAVVACLRSPLAAVGDADLVKCVERGVPPGRLLTVPAKEIARLSLPAVTAAVERLHALRGRLRGLSPADLLRVVLYDSPLGPLEAAGYDGQGRFANLEALVERVALWSGAGVHDLEDVVDRLARESRGLTEAEESPLADPATDAVRLLTIHKAKGLEFEIVVVPDLGREPKGSRLRDTFHVLRESAGDRILLQLDSMQSPLFPLFEERAQRHEEAEEIRLVYVALTRARDSVILSYTRPGNRKAPWTAALSHIGFDPRHPPASGTRIANLLYERVTQVERPASRSEGAALEVPPLLERAHALQDYEEQLARCRRPNLRGPSAATAPRAESGRLPASPLPLAVGSAVHDYLLGADLASDEVDEGRLRAIADAQAARVPAPRAAARVFRAAGEILRGFVGSPLQDRLKNVDLLGRELPVLFAGTDAARWHGAIDLLFREAGNLVVADFKTDRIEGDLRGHVARYAPQMRLYCEAIRRGFGLDASPRAELLFLRRGEAVVVPATDPP